MVAAERLFFVLIPALGAGAVSAGAARRFRSSGIDPALSIQTSNRDAIRSRYFRKGENGLIQHAGGFAGFALPNQTG
jgi:hypothetical protein